MAKKRAEDKVTAKPAIRPTLATKVAKSIDNCLSYLYDEERIDAIHYFLDNGTLDGHIMVDILRVDAWKRGADFKKELAAFTEECEQRREAHINAMKAPQTATTEE